MEPQFVYARAETPPDPIRRHSRPRGRCEGIFWRPFNPKDIGRYLMAAERFERCEEIDALVASLARILKFFGGA